MAALPHGKPAQAQGRQSNCQIWCERGSEVGQKLDNGATDLPVCLHCLPIVTATSCLDIAKDLEEHVKRSAIAAFVGSVAAASNRPRIMVQLNCMNHNI